MPLTRSVMTSMVESDISLSLYVLFSSFLLPDWAERVIILFISFSSLPSELLALSSSRHCVKKTTNTDEYTLLDVKDNTPCLNDKL